MTETTPDLRYPRLVRRVQAALIDVFIFLIVFFGFGFLLSAIGLPGIVNAALFAAVVLILEPGLVCMTGGTLGHHALGLKIQDSQTGNNLNPFLAFVRFVLKWVIGWVSFVLILVTKRHQAVHDKGSNSVVVIRNPVGAQGEPERKFDHVKYEYPSVFQRVVVIVLYCVLSVFALGALLFLVLSEACMFADRCTPIESLFENAMSVVWFGICVAALYYGWAERLFGARRKLRNS